eukprot:TRINITY_DN2500_c0_g2_i1.p1 TRINITY_DN2500_c0_g2~~TRINITY_DN2500_c0_g2_i1.p1  ORF type:complete len:1270 (+),score=400.44 TRINITY_DN2500_c0_g2_i1:557-3811(+)
MKTTIMHTSSASEDLSSIITGESKGTYEEMSPFSPPAPAAIATMGIKDMKRKVHPLTREFKDRTISLRSECTSKLDIPAAMLKMTCGETSKQRKGFGRFSRNRNRRNRRKASPAGTPIDESDGSSDRSSIVLSKPRSVRQRRSVSSMKMRKASSSQNNHSNRSESVQRALPSTRSYPSMVATPNNENNNKLNKERRNISKKKKDNNMSPVMETASSTNISVTKDKDKSELLIDFKKAIEGMDKAEARRVFESLLANDMNSERSSRSTSPTSNRSSDDVTPTQQPITVSRTAVPPGLPRAPSVSLNNGRPPSLPSSLQQQVRPPILNKAPRGMSLSPPLPGRGPLQRPPPSLANPPPLITSSKSPPFPTSNNPALLGRPPPLSKTNSQGTRPPPLTKTNTNNTSLARPPPLSKGSPMARPPPLTKTNIGSSPLAPLSSGSPMARPPSLSKGSPMARPPPLPGRGLLLSPPPPLNGSLSPLSGTSSPSPLITPVSSISSPLVRPPPGLMAMRPPPPMFGSPGPRSPPPMAGSPNVRSPPPRGGPRGPPRGPPRGMLGGLFSRNKSSLPPPISKKASTKHKGGRKLHWQALPQDRISKDSVWLKAHDNENMQLDLDMKEFEELFLAKKISAKPTIVQKSPAKKAKRTLISSQRSTNIAIGLARIPLSCADLAKALSEMKFDSMSVEHWESLEPLLPNMDELKIFQKFKGSSSELAEADQFFLAIKDIPRCNGIAKSIILRLRFEERLKDVDGKLHQVLKSCEELLESKLFQQLLQVVLFVGNTLNDNSGGKALHGFTLQSLLKLAETKALSGKMTMLHYVITLCKRNSPEVIKFTNDLSSVSNARKVVFGQLEADMNLLKRDVGNASREFMKQSGEASKKAKKKPSAAERLKNSTTLSKFVDEDATKSIEDLFQKYETASTKFKEVLKFFGQDPKMKPEDFFQTLYQFLMMFERCVGEVAKEEDRKKRIQEKKDREEKRKEELEAKAIAHKKAQLEKEEMKKLKAHQTDLEIINKQKGENHNCKTADITTTDTTDAGSTNQHPQSPLKPLRSIHNKRTPIRQKKFMQHSSSDEDSDSAAERSDFDGI